MSKRLMHGIELVGGRDLNEEEKQAVSDICRQWREYCYNKDRSDFPWQILAILEETRLELEVVLWSPRRFRVKNGLRGRASLTLIDGKGYVHVHRVIEVNGRLLVEKEGS